MCARHRRNEAPDLAVLDNTDVLILADNVSDGLSSVPDLICVLDSVSSETVGTETTRNGQRIDVVSLPAADVMVGADGLASVGLRAFGYDIDFVSLHRRDDQAARP